MKDGLPMQGRAPTGGGGQAAPSTSAAMGIFGAPAGTAQGASGSAVGQAFGANEGMQRAAAGGMEPSVAADIMAALFGSGPTATGQANEAAGRPWRM